MATLRIMGVQMTVGPNKAQNLAKILHSIERSDCDLIVFPERALTGHNAEFSDTRTAEAWRSIAHHCRTHYKAVIFGTGARAEGHGYVQARLYGDDGELLGTQEKLVPSEAERTWCRPGAELHTFDFRGMSLGVLNGNDLWVTPGLGPYHDPRLSFNLAQKGVDFIVHLNDSGVDPIFGAWHEANLFLRAREAKRPILTINAAHLDKPLNCPSGVVEPSGAWIVKCATTGEQHFEYEFETD